MKDFMIVPHLPSTPSGAISSPTDISYSITIEPIEEHLQVAISDEQIKNYFISLSLEDQQSLLSALKKIATKTPKTPTKKKAPDTNQLSFDDIG